LPFLSRQSFFQLLFFGKPELIVPIKIMSLYVLFHGIFTFFISGFYALKKFQYRAIYWLVFNISRFIIVPLLIFLGFSLGGALIGTVISMALGIFVLVYFMLRRFGFMLFGKIKNIDRHIILRFLSFLTISSVSSAIFFNIDAIMIGMFLSAEEQQLKETLPRQKRQMK